MNTTTTTITEKFYNFLEVAIALLALAFLISALVFMYTTNARITQLIDANHYQLQLQSEMRDILNCQTYEDCQTN